MRRICRKLGYVYVRGKKRHYLAESSASVAFRASYIKKLAKRPNKKGFPRNPEVFLDESYCNVNHVAGKTWLTADRTRYEKSGKGTRRMEQFTKAISCLDLLNTGIPHSNRKEKTTTTAISTPLNSNGGLKSCARR
ncbi:hypothetical protein PF005_g10713 [Phytophthora fragariae]|uniref:Uncharacterized protein n=1 Tax=Phytophthora fragariae TaxID=53985 RepID=A0A6A3Y4U5_9STRA|nr:hypothetical protein PF003_g36360 [Phytophthora fragariae]KAE9212178.1 hypothetical protein PF005_g10713 [Phytophthora fragariae]